MKKHLIFVALFTLLTLTGCASWRVEVIEIGEVSEAICESLGLNLPTRSHHDTDQTNEEITALYLSFKKACPAHDHLIPL